MTSPDCGFRFLACALATIALGARADECQLPRGASRDRDTRAALETAAAAPTPELAARALARVALGLARTGEREAALTGADQALSLNFAGDEARLEVVATVAPVLARFRGRAAARAELTRALGPSSASLAGHRLGAYANLARLEEDPGQRRIRSLAALEGRDTPPLPRLVAAETLLAVARREDLPLVERHARAAYDRADAVGDGSLAADALAVLAGARAASGDHASARVLADRAVTLAGAADAPRLADWLWLRARLRARDADAEGALADLSSAHERLQASRSEVESRLADFGETFRERYGNLYLEYADIILARAALEADPSSRAALLVRARDAVETAKAAEVAEYFQDPCMARPAKARIEQADAGTLAIYYVFLPDRVVALASHREGIEQVRLGATAREISDGVDDFRRLVEKRSTRQYLRPAQALYRALLEPLEPLLARISPATLVVVPDGALRTIPFAALHDGRGFIAQRYAVGVSPSLYLTDPRSLAMARGGAVVEGLTQSRQGFPSLPAVAQEAEALSRILSAHVVLDEGFLKKDLLAELAGSRAGIVHIASHGQFSTRFEDSFVLTYDGRIGIDDLRRAIAAGKTRPEPIELLALSACQTAAGDERAALGLAGVAVRAGARSALASLWFVNDESTAMLVTEFYRNAVTRRLPRAESLRRAQLAMLEDDRYNHPAYWAAFLMIGSWL